MPSSVTGKENKAKHQLLHLLERNKTKTSQRRHGCNLDHEINCLKNEKKNHESFYLFVALQSNRDYIILQCKILLFLCRSFTAVVLDYL